MKILFLAHGSFTRSQPHRYASYGIVPSDTPSDDESDSEGALPRSALNPPIEALQGLANAAVEAANSPELSPRYVNAYIPSASDRFNYIRVRKRKKAELAPRNAFPHVVEKVRNPVHPVLPTG